MEGGLLACGHRLDAVQERVSAYVLKPCLGMAGAPVAAHGAWLRVAVLAALVTSSHRSQVAAQADADRVLLAVTSQSFFREKIVGELVRSRFASTAACPVSALAAGQGRR